MNFKTLAYMVLSLCCAQERETNEWTSQKQYAPTFFQNWGHKEFTPNGSKFVCFRLHSFLEGVCKQVVLVSASPA